MRCWLYQKIPTPPEHANSIKRYQLNSQLHPNIPTSRTQSLHFPVLILYRIPPKRKPVMDSVPTTLPKLPLQRLDPQSSPKRRTRNPVLVLKPLFNFLQPVFQLLPVLDRNGLGRGPRAYSRLTRPRVEIDLRFLVCQKLRHTFNSHLPLEFWPKKTERRVRIALNILGLFRRAPVAVHNKGTVLAKLFA